MLLTLVAAGAAWAGGAGEPYIGVVNLDQNPQSQRFEMFLEGLRGDGKNMTIARIPAKEASKFVRTSDCSIDEQPFLRWRNLRERNGTKPFSYVVLYCSSGEPATEEARKRFYFEENGRPRITMRLRWGDSSPLLVRLEPPRGTVGRAKLRRLGKMFRAEGDHLENAFP